MFQLIGTQYSWVSNTSFFEYSKKISNLNWDNFTKEQLIEPEKVSSLLKVRANLNFLSQIGLVVRINRYYTIANNNPYAIDFFKNLKRGNEEEAISYLKKILQGQPFIHLILTQFLGEIKTRTTKELQDFLKDKDTKKRKLFYYIAGSKFFANLLDRVGLVKYEQGKRMLTLIPDGEIKREEPRPQLITSTKNKSVLIIKVKNENIEIPLPTNKVTEIIMGLPEAEKQKIISKILEG